MPKITDAEFTVVSEGRPLRRRSALARWAAPNGWRHELIVLRRGAVRLVLLVLGIYLASAIWRGTGHH